ncbi:multicopper oxidase family protein [Terrarubrum flagellatum]|uniref:multicopper oxidase family protein n=1 Tax=Terrirubrum flagellatum TaxID=2895980 RepID=UPI003144F817
MASKAAQAQIPPALPSFPPKPSPLTIEARKADLRIRPEPAPATPIWSYNGGCPGPVIRVKQGEDIAVRLANKLEETTSIHWYGLRTEAALDGVAGLSSKGAGPGETIDIRLPARDAGTYLYQPCVAGRTAEQVDRGLYGVLIVEERTPPQVDKDILVVIDDWRLGEDGAIPAPAKPEPGALPRLGNVLVINGAPKAFEDTIPTGGRARVRVVNASTARILTLRFEGVPATIVAIDGQPSSTAFQPKGAAAILTPNGRADLMIDLPGDAGQQFALKVQITPEVAVPAFILKSAGDRRAALPPIAALPPNDLPKILDLARAQRVDLTIEGGPQPQGKPTAWTLNRRTGPVFGGPALFSAKRGTTMVLSFHNKTEIAQAMRIHGHHGRLLFVLDDGWDPFWVDTALVQPGLTARLVFVADNPGKWALRSAMADLFDAGLGGWFEVL